MPYFHRCFIDVLIWHQESSSSDLPASGTDWQNDAGNRCICAGRLIPVLIPVLYGSGRWCKCLSCLPVFYLFYIVLPCVIGLLVVLNWMLLECSKHFCKIVITESEEISRIVPHIQPPSVPLCPHQLLSGGGWSCPCTFCPAINPQRMLGTHTQRAFAGELLSFALPQFFFGHQYVELVYKCA